MSDDDISRPVPVARLLALVPVILIAAGAIAFVLGYRLEGRVYTTLEWRTHTIAEHNFVVEAPGLFTINQQMMSFEGVDVLAPTYISSDRGVAFSVSAVRRLDADQRPFDEVAKSLALRGTDAVQRPDGGTGFRHDVAVEGTRTQAALIFQDRMMYQLMVTAPTGTFPVADAERFFASFRLQNKP